MYEQCFKEVSLVFYGEGAPLEIYVGCIEEIAIVTRNIANVGGIYFVMTHPKYRMHGYGTEMITFLLRRAKEKRISFSNSSSI